MPVINDGIWYSVDELFTGRSGTAFDASFKREYVRRFRVVVMDQTLGPIAVCGAPGLPLAWDNYTSGIGTEFDVYARCVNLRAEQEHDDDWQSWIVYATFSTDIPGGGLPSDYTSGGGSPSSGSGSQNQPENEPVDMDWDSEEKDEPLPFDLDGKPFLNSAQQPFTPPPTFPTATPILVFSKNYLTWNHQDQARCSYVTNTDTVWGAPVKTLLMLPPKPKLTHKGTLKYWKVTFRIKFQSRYDENGDTLKYNPYKILNRGTKERNPVTGALDPIYDGHVHPVTHPVLLDETGMQQVAVDGDGLLIPTYQEFKMYQEQSFETLLGADVISEIADLIGV